MRERPVLTEASSANYTYTKIFINRAPGGPLPYLRPLAIAIMAKKIAAYQAANPPPTGWCPQCWHSRGRAIPAATCPLHATKPIAQTT